MRITCTHTYLLNNFTCDLIEQQKNLDQVVKKNKVRKSNANNMYHLSTITCNLT